MVIKDQTLATKEQKLFDEWQTAEVAWWNSKEAREAQNNKEYENVLHTRDAYYTNTKNIRKEWEKEQAARPVNRIKLFWNKLIEHKKEANDD